AAAGPNVRVVGRLSDRERDRWLASAQAFIFAAEEDFGIAPLEAQAAGMPVIALARAAANETIRGLDDPAPTGVLYAEQTAAAIAHAVRAYEAHWHRIAPAACIENAHRFEPERFRRELSAFVDARWDDFVTHRAAT
ncbi:MAG: glycosyltransferase, partial [Casimicrobiaceae bacterium]